MEAVVESPKFVGVTIEYREKEGCPLEHLTVSVTSPFPPVHLPLLIFSSREFVSLTSVLSHHRVKVFDLHNFLHSLPFAKYKNKPAPLRKSQKRNSAARLVWLTLSSPFPPPFLPLPPLTGI